MSSSTTLDSLHAAWQILDRRMERHNGLLIEQARRSSLECLRRRLRPLAWGQVTQILLGLGLILMAVPVWSTHREISHVFVSGLILHAYGVATIILGGVTLGALTRLDYGAPVVALQKRLLGLQKLYITASTTLGLTWWILWIPFAAVAFAWLGVDFIKGVQPAMPWMIGGGVLGLAATWLFHRWARRRPSLHARMTRSMMGSSLVAANIELESLRELESGNMDRAEGQAGGEFT